MTNNLEPPIPAMGEPGRLLTELRIHGGWSCRWCTSRLYDLGVVWCEFCDLEPLTPRADAR